MWQVLSVSLGDLNNTKKALWSKHPLGWSLAAKVIAHFEQRRDIQQVAMVAALILGKEHQIYSEQQKRIEIQRKEDELKERNLIYMAKKFSQFAQDELFINNSVQKRGPERFHPSIKQKPIPKVNSEKTLLHNSSSKESHKGSYTSQPNLLMSPRKTDEMSPTPEMLLRGKLQMALAADSKSKSPEQATLTSTKNFSKNNLVNADSWYNY